MATMLPSPETDRSNPTRSVGLHSADTMEERADGSGGGVPNVSRLRWARSSGRDARPADALWVSDVTAGIKPVVAGGVTVAADVADCGAGADTDDDDGLRSDLGMLDGARAPVPVPGPASADESMVRAVMPEAVANEPSG